MPENTLDWALFTQEKPEFHKLFQLIAKWVLDSAPADDDTAGSVILELISASLPDFDDILLLCSYDRHWGALKLLRSLFERTVTIKYLAQNPAEVAAFWNSTPWIGTPCFLVLKQDTASAQESTLGSTSKTLPGKCEIASRGATNAATVNRQVGRLVPQ